jgi:hypothetical protein
MSETEEKLVEHHYEGVLRHPRTSEESRAAQFAPFSALNGYEQAIRMAAKRHEARYERSLENEEQERIDHDVSSL